MNTSRRGTGRKNQNVPRENTQDISQFVHRRSKEELVEIDDDDEVQVLTDQFAFAEEDIQPMPVKRKKKNLMFEDSDDDLDEMEGMDEDEKRQIKEAIKQSKLQLEVESKRRTTYAKTNMKLISESEQAKSGRTAAEDSKAYSQDETQDYFSEVQSSPVSSGVEKHQEERAESPDLFGTPISEKEEPENIPEKSSSPSKTPLKSKTNFSTDDLKASLDKGIVINLTPVKRQLDSNTKSKLKLKKKDSSRNQDKELAKNTSKFESKEDQDQHDLTLESKKRKHILDDEDDDDTEESESDFVVKDSKKKQKTIEQVFNVKSMKKDVKQKPLDPFQVVIRDDDDDEGSMEDDDKIQKRNDPTKKMKKSSTTRLERAYSKPRLSVKTIKDAMKAKLYFAPQGVDPKTYTYAIMRMMDHTRKRIYRAQRKSLNFIKWGKPIVVGPREGNSLDARKEKKKSNLDVASTSAFTPLEGPSLERKRSLRSAQTSTAAPSIKTEPVTVSAREGSRRVRRDIIDSDESDDDLTKPIFGEITSKPKPWKYLSTKDFGSFGENVITSTEYKEKSVETSAFKREPSVNKAATSSSTVVKETTNVTETKQDEVDENDGEHKNRKSEKMNEKLENLQKVAESKTKTDGRAPSKIKGNLNNQNAEISWISQDEDTPVKTQMEKQRTILSEFFEKQEEEEIDSSIEIGMNKSKKHVKKALIEDVEEAEDEEEEDSHCPLAKYGIEVKDDDFVGRDFHDLNTNTESARDTKPGASLTNVAAKSGFLKVDRTPTKIPKVQRVMSSAARRAAEAAENRMKAPTLQSSPDISSSIEPSQEIIPSSEDNHIECPICFTKFYKEDIEAHAATCDERASNPTSFSPRKLATNSESQKSIGSPADSEEQKNKGFGLKNLRVMVARSPEARSKLMEQKNPSGSKARRNLSLKKTPSSTVTTNTQETETRRARRFIDMTMNDDNNPEVKKEDSADEKDTPDEDSQTTTWFSTTASQMERKKNKFKVTYGGKKKKQVDPRNNPFATLDHMHLEDYPSSDDIEHGDNKIGDIKGAVDEEEKSGMTESQEKKGDTIDVTVKSVSSLTMENNTISYDKYSGIESDSEESDIEMLATYGVNVESKKRKFEDKQSINDILRPQRQQNPKKKKRTESGLDDDGDDDDYKNEMALLELSGVNLKRSKVENKPSRRATRKRRVSSSEEGEDDSDEFESCFICFEKVPKEDYKDHTDKCLEKKGECFVTPGKDLNSNISSRSRSTGRQSTAGSSKQTIEMDSDEISDSPVKTFKLIGEDSGSCVDFSNQFAFFNKGSETRRGRSRSSGRNKGGKYKGKGRYKRGRGKRKH